MTHTGNLRLKPHQCLDSAGHSPGGDLACAFPARYSNGVRGSRASPGQIPCSLQPPQSAAGSRSPAEPPGWAPLRAPRRCVLGAHTLGGAGKLRRGRCRGSPVGSSTASGPDTAGADGGAIILLRGRLCSATRLSALLPVVAAGCGPAPRGRAAGGGGGASGAAPGSGGGGGRFLKASRRCPPRICPTTNRGGPRSPAGGTRRPRAQRGPGEHRASAPPPSPAHSPAGAAAAVRAPLQPVLEGRVHCPVYNRAAPLDPGPEEGRAPLWPLWARQAHWVSQARVPQRLHTSPSLGKKTQPPWLKTKTWHNAPQVSSTCGSVSPLPSGFSFRRHCSPCILVHTLLLPTTIPTMSLSYPH